jgi:hypothetical protein
MLWPLVTLAALAGVIWYLGTGRFGRAQTQAWIDRAHRNPRLHRLLNDHHGSLRASGHYFEFGGLFLVLYWLVDAAVGGGGWGWHPLWAAGLWVVCAVAAWLDELHQLQSGTRQFRRVDFLHSCCGISIAAAIVFYQAWIRLG